jgi:hypothetical protein
MTPFVPKDEKKGVRRDSGCRQVGTKPLLLRRSSEKG